VRSRAAALAATLASAAFATSFDARAGDGASACIDAHTDGQVLRNQGRLVAARDSLLVCASDACPAIIRAECATLAAAVESETPSVVFAATDAAGDDVGDASVRIDGGDAHALDGRAVPLDPGPHAFVFDAPGRDARDARIVLREAEQFRKIGVVFGPDQTRGLRLNPFTLVFGGIGVVATASFAYFGLEGHATQSDLQEHCAPDCSREQVAPMRQQYLIADASLVVALASLGLATYFFVKPPGHGSSTTETARAKAPSLSWAPVVAPGLGLITARGQF
jgi:hypothetical protein